MAIVKKQPGEAKATAKAGEIIGKAAKEKQAEEEARRQQELSFRQAAQQRAMEWEIEKMTLRSQQDFQRELRAKQWDLEKLEIRSRLDFEQEEKERQRRIDGISSSLLAVEKAVESGRHTEEQVANIKTKLEMELEAAKAGSPITIPVSGIRQPQKENILNLLGGGTSPPSPEGVSTVTNPITNEPVYIPENQPFVTVRHPTMGLKKIRREQLQEALAEGSVYVPTQPSIARKRKTGDISAETLGLYGGF